jgi:hypothetical protein
MASKLILLLLLAQQPPQTAFLECTADISLPATPGDATILNAGGGKTVLLSFRMAAAEGWKIEKAVLLLHFPTNTTPQKIRLAAIQDKWTEKSDSLPALTAFQEATERSKPDGWITIPIPAELLAPKYAGLALQGPKQSFHSRRSVQFSPYLVVQGTR